ncbi:MAG: VWA domain-containing protein [Treponema sp.]|nr:VWA domain-containing protein [Treponema sp.]
MKRAILAIVLVIFACFFVYGQNSPIDLVLLLDTSSSMSSSYDNVNDYLTGAFLSEFLRVGDTFHLITFSGTTRLDVSRRISGIGVVETIIGRMLLHYPIERGNNAGGALTFTEQYLTTLPERSKKIVLITLGNSNTNNLVSESRQRLNSRDTTIDYIQVTAGQPLTNLPVSGRSPAAGSTGQTGTGSGIDSQQPDDSTQTNQQDGVTDSTGLTPVTPDNLTDTRDWDASMPWIIGLIILGLLLLGLLMFFVARRVKSGPNREIATARAGSAAAAGAKAATNEKFVDHSKDLAKYASAQNRRTTPYDDRPTAIDKNKPIIINPSGPLLLNLYVDEQSVAIGKRNIHSLKSGYSLSVGGSKSDDFYMFLVPLPGNLGEIRRNGSQLTFIPKKPKYFPDIGSSEVRDCLYKTIRVISDKNYEVRFRFEMYEDPLIVLNRMLMSVKVPG